MATVSPMPKVSCHFVRVCHSSLPALMNVIECMLCLEYIYLRHTSPRSQRSETNQHRPPYHAHAPLVGFAASVMTLSKTALYILQGSFELATATW